MNKLTNRRRLQRTGARRGSVGLILGAVIALVAGLLTFVVSPAFAADDLGEANMTIAKTVSKPVVKSGEIFSYTIPFTCSSTETGCVDAVITDSIPEGLELVPGVTNPSVVAAADFTVDWNGHGSTPQAGDRDLTITFTSTVANTGGRKGLPAGISGTVTVTVQFPPNLPKTDDGKIVTNSVDMTAANADPQTGQVPVELDVPTSLAAAGGKTWSPEQAQFDPGADSTITLTAKNNSNIPADTLTILDPVAPADPFNVVNLTGFGAVSWPAGADRIQINGTLQGGGTFTGAPSGTAEVPAGVDLSQVTGLEIIFSSTAGTALTANGSAGSIVLDVEQRSVRRDGSTTPPLSNGVTANNSSQVVASTPEGDSDPAPAGDTYVITPLTVSVGANKTFTPAAIPGGGTSVAQLTATNTSSGPLTSLTITEPGSGTFFSNNIIFGGFDAATSGWPAGATGAVITVTTTGAPLVFNLNAGDPVPTVPAGTTVTGFTAVFNGSIAAGASAKVGFTVDTTAAAGPTPGPGAPASNPYVNTIKVDGSNAAGNATPVTKDATLTVSTPAVSVQVAKSVSPAGVIPGGRTLVQLTATTPSGTTTVRPTEIVLTEPTDPLNSPFWNNFNVTAIAPTSVPAGASLLIEYTTDGTSWQALATAAGGTVFSQTIDPALAPTIIGLRYTFTDADGFAPSTQVKANASFRARSVQRDGGTTTPNGAAGTSYENCGLAEASRGALEAEPKEACNDDATIYQPNGGAGVPVDKDYDGSGTVSARSQDTIGALLRWSAYESNLATVRVSDPSNPSDPIAGSSFDAFNLVRIDGISPTAPANPATTATVWGDPLMRWDSVASVVLTNADGSTTDLTTAICGAPAATAGPCDGTFPGYTLTTAQQANAVGFRITFKENPFRQAQIDATGDVNAPEVGSGVATSNVGAGGSTDALRPVHIKVQVRDTLRSSGAPALGGTAYNTPGEPGVVTNTVSTLGTRQAGGTIAGGWSDTVNIIDQPLTAKVSKSATPGSLTIPVDGTPTANYPSTTFVVGGYNTSPTRVDQLTLSDPASGADPYSAATNPFEFLTITKVTVKEPAGAVAGNTVVTVFYRSAAGVVTSQTYTRTAANALVAADLATAVGVTAEFNGRISTCRPATSVPACAGTITLVAQLRDGARSDGSAILDTDSPVVNPAKVVLDDLQLSQPNRPAGDDPEDTTSANVVLSAGNLAVAPGKTITPNSVVISTPGAKTAAVVLTARNTGTVSPTQLVLTDDAADFWNKFDLTSFTVDGAPAGADQVRVDARLANGTWVDGTFGGFAAAALPAGVSPAQVAGIRFTINRADGAEFNNTANATATLQVTLRSVERDGSGAVGTGTIDNSVTALLTRGTLSSEKAAAATYTVNPGTAQLKVYKNGPAEVDAGSTVAYQLTFVNSGTGFLTDPVVVDTLPAGGNLYIEPNAEVGYATSAGGTLPTATSGANRVQWGLAGGKITFSFPAGSVMQPGESYTITLPLTVKAGLQESVTLVNTFGVTPAETLAGCSTVVAGQPAATMADNTCSTTSTSKVRKTGGFTTEKGVKGAAGNGTAVNVTSPGTPCVSDADGYFRYPCADGSLINGTDSWKLKVVNGGNIPSDRLRLIDVLPYPGDVGVVATGQRRSNYRPAFAGNVQMTTNALGNGTTYEYFVTTDPNPCRSDIDLSPGATACPAGSWLPSSELGVSVQPADVTGLKFVFAFDDLPNQLLPPAAAIDITYDTVNIPSTAAGDERVPAAAVTVPSRAWNSFGVGGSFTETGGRPTVRKPAEGIKAGVQQLTGPIRMTKKVTGASASFAPTSFQATVSCAIGTGPHALPITLPNGGVITLNAADNYTVTIDGIPFTSVCSVDENGDEGSYGETTRTESAPVTITAAGTVDGNGTVVVPGSQQLTVTNDYPDAELTVKKVVSTDALGTFGPFPFTVSCVFNGNPVTLATADAAFTLSDGESHTVSGLPFGAVCTVTETGVDGAGSTTVTVDDDPAVAFDNLRMPFVAPLAAGVAVGADGSTVSFDNHYPSGTLKVRKTVTGTGGETYGSGPFSAEVICTYRDQELFNGTITIVNGVDTPVDGTFPVGTVCSVEEILTGGANESTGPLSVELVQGPNLVDITNTFNTGTLSVKKAWTGDGQQTYGAGPFTVQISCSYPVNGDTVSVLLPGAVPGRLVLDSSNGWSATLADADGSPFGLPEGASCDVVETVTGGATSHLDATDVVIVKDTLLQATVTNAFDLGTLVITKVVDGDGRDSFGAGPFTIGYSCVFPGTAVEPLIGAVTVTRDDPTATISGLLVGATCTVTEAADADGGATATSLSPADGVVTVTAPVPGEPDATVTVTNTFDVADLVITKGVTGEGAADFGAGPFEVTVSCVYEGVAVDLGDRAVRSITARTPVTISGIPVGAVCTVTESDAAGATSTTVNTVTGTAAEVTILPSGTTADIVNSFDLGDLVVRKIRVGVGAKVFGAGPFTVELHCTVQLAVLTDLGTTHLVLSDQNGYQATLEGLPIGAVCSVTEVADGGAANTVVLPNDGVETSVGVATVVAGDPVVVTVTNRFDIGDLKIVKKRVGPGAAEFGTGPFTVFLSCSWTMTLGVDGEPEMVAPLTADLWREYTLDQSNGYQVTIKDLPAGTVCFLAETDQGLATKSEITSPEMASTGAVTVVSDETTVFTVTNTFERGQLSIDKVVDEPVVSAGDEVKYTVTTENIGTIDAVGVQVDDLLPAGATFVSASDGGKFEDRKISWTIGSLKVGDSVTFTVTVRFAEAGVFWNSFGVVTPEGPWSPPVVANACPSGIEADGSTSDDRSCAEVTVVEVAPTTATPTTTPTTTTTCEVVGKNDCHLPNTGVNVGGLVWVALLALAGGGLFLLLAGRRRRQDGSHV